MLRSALQQKRTTFEDPEWGQEIGTKTGRAKDLPSTLVPLCLRCDSQLLRRFLLLAEELELARDSGLNIIRSQRWSVADRQQRTNREPGRG